MRRTAWNAFKASLSKIREGASNELALESKAIYPAWNGEVIYSVGDRVRDGDDLYKRIQPQTAPEIYAPHEAPALWVRVWVEEWPEWVPPLGSEDSYALGAKVSHNGKHWVSTMNANVYEPGIYGWSLEGEHEDE